MVQPPEVVAGIVIPTTAPTGHTEWLIFGIVVGKLGVLVLLIGLTGTLVHSLRLGRALAPVGSSTTAEDWARSSRAAEEMREMARPFVPREGWTATYEAEGGSVRLGSGVRLRISGPETMESFRCAVRGPEGEPYKENPALSADFLRAIILTEDSRRWPDEFIPLVNSPWPSGEYDVWWYGSLAGAEAALAKTQFRVGADGSLSP